MAKPKTEIPISDIKGLATLVKEGYTQERMAVYYGVDQATISRRFQDIADAFNSLGVSIRKSFGPVCKAMEDLASNPEFMAALEAAAKESKKHVLGDSWELLDSRPIFNLGGYSVDIRLPKGEYRLETTFGEEVPFTTRFDNPDCKNFTVTADLPKNTVRLYVFKKK
jgi:hypothetical protein